MAGSLSLVSQGGPRVFTHRVRSADGGAVKHETLKSDPDERGSPTQLEERPFGYEQMNLCAGFSS